MENIEITFLGSGSAFTLAEENYQSNILISKKVQNLTKHFLYDAGSTIAESLNAQKLIPQDLDTIYISHLHDDHAGGIEYIAFKTYFETYNFGKPEFGSMRPRLIGHETVLLNGWDNCWKGGLESLRHKTNSLEDYFQCKYLKDNENFDFYGTEIQSIRTVHIEDDKRVVPSYGLVIKGNKKVFISGDTQFTPNLLDKIYNSVDLIFHDCEFADYKGSVHSQFHQLSGLNNRVKSKMYLYHYALNGKTFNELEKQVIDNGFAGLVKRGQKFII